MSVDDEDSGRSHVCACVWTAECGLQSVGRAATLAHSGGRERPSELSLGRGACPCVWREIELGAASNVAPRQWPLEAQVRPARSCSPAQHRRRPAHCLWPTDRLFCACACRTRQKPALMMLICASPVKMAAAVCAWRWRRTHLPGRLLAGAPAWSTGLELWPGALRAARTTGARASPTQPAHCARTAAQSLSFIWLIGRLLFWPPLLVPGLSAALWLAA